MIHVLICDAKTARLFQATPDRKLEEIADFRNYGLKTHERDLVSDRPGRIANPAAHVRQAYEASTSSRQHATQRWLKNLEPTLQSLLAVHNAEALVLVATPRMLSRLKQCCAEAFQGLSIVEVPRDLARLHPSVLAKRLPAAILEARRESLWADAVRRPTLPRITAQRRRGKVGKGRSGAHT